jgi:hypothetical protein
LSSIFTEVHVFLKIIDETSVNLIIPVLLEFGVEFGVRPPNCLHRFALNRLKAFDVNFLEQNFIFRKAIVEGIDEMKASIKRFAKVTKKKQVLFSHTTTTCSLFYRLS